MNAKVAVLGCGYWGKNLVRCFHELGALAAIHDPDPAAAATMVEKHGVPARSLDEILDDPVIAGVAIAAPAELHHAVAIRALRSGKHVFVEKPIALTLDDAEEMVGLAEEHGLELMVGHVLRYHPAFERLKEMVLAGDLGRLLNIHSSRLNLGKVRRAENAMWSLAPHDISMILALTGEDPSRVLAVGAYCLHRTLADIITTHISFPSGVEAQIYVSWLHPFKEQKLTVIGEKAMAVFDDAEPWERKLRLYDHRIEWENGAPVPVRDGGRFVEVQQHEPLKRECRHFLETIAGGGPARTDGREGLRVLDVLQAGQKSLVEGRAVDLGETAVRRSRFPGVFVHETATVDDDVEIGSGSRIRRFSLIRRRVRIGHGVTVGQNAVIGPDVTVGDGCKIQNNVGLYEGVVLEDGVFCGPSCVFTDVVNPRAEIERPTAIPPTLVRRGATIGANATVVSGTTLGEWCFVGAGAVVTKDVPAHALVVGNPARIVGWMSRAGRRLGPDLVCPETGTRYEFDETGNALREVP